MPVTPSMSCWKSASADSPASGFAMAGRGLEHLREVASTRVRELPAGVGVLCGAVRSELDVDDVVDAVPVQPVVHVRQLEVRAEARASTGSVDGAGIDDCGPLPVEEAGVSGDR